MGNKQTSSVIMDFAKAFDKVNHSLLIHKLNQYGIQGEISRWISDFLNNRRQAVHACQRCPSVPSLSASSLVYHKGASWDPACSSFTSVNGDLPDTLTAQTRLFADDTAAYNVGPALTLTRPNYNETSTSLLSGRKDGIWPST